MQYVYWRTAAGELRQASIHMAADGLRIEYGESDRIGRWTRTVGTEIAPWHVMPLPFGGSRRWLGCPGCGRRCRALHCGEAVLRCRLCLGLKYRTQNMQPADRCSYRMHRLRKDRLKDDWLDLLDGCPPKPKWMRWHTYERLAALDEGLAMRRDAEFMRRLLKYATT